MNRKMLLSILHLRIPVNRVIKLTLASYGKSNKAKALKLYYVRKALILLKKTLSLNSKISDLIETKNSNS